MTRYTVAFELQVYAPNDGKALEAALAHMDDVREQTAPLVDMMKNITPEHHEGGLAWGSLQGAPHTAEGFGWRCLTSVKPE